MGKANLFGIVMIILCINIFLFISGVRVVDDTSHDFIGMFVDAPAGDQMFSTNVTMGMGSDLNESIPTTLQESGGSSGVLTFIDAIKIIWAFILLLVNIVLTPIGLFVSLPAGIGLIFGVPLLVGGLIAIVSFIRSGN